jgi:ketosteroid isomerase-like protein
MADGPTDSEAVVRRAVEAFNRGDFDGVAELMHPEIEVIRLGGLGTLSGREAAIGLMVPDAFESQEQSIEELRSEDEVVMLTGTFRARGAGSGIELNRESHTVFWVEGGLIRRMGSYLEREEALAASGFVELG